MPIQAIDRDGRTVRITVSEALRAGDLDLIRSALNLGERRGSVVVDFRGTRECPPPVLLELLDLFLSLAVPYEFTGLSDHNRRVLGYLRPGAVRPPPTSDGGGGEEG